MITEAAKLGHFSPKLRVFTHTCGLDHRLWGANEKLKPEVRSYILHSITAMWGSEFKDWGKWARVYFAGSEASEWTSDNLEGNNDFDVLVGVDYNKFRKANPEYAGVDNASITDIMNQGFRSFNSDHVWLPIRATEDMEGVAPWHPSSNLMSNGPSSDTLKMASQQLQSQEKREWEYRPSVELSKFRALLAIRREQRGRGVSLPELSVSFALHRSGSRSLRTKAGVEQLDATHAVVNMSATTTSDESMESRQANMISAWLSKEAAARSVLDATFRSTLTMTISAAQESSLAGSVFGESSVDAATPLSAISVNTTSHPQAVISLNGAPGTPLPEGWMWTGPWSRTTYVNPNSYDIRDIKPYAAYDVGKNEWAVKPPHLPHWGLDKLPEATRKVLRATDSLARRTLSLPEPERTQQGAALFDAWHTDRSRAFGPNGEGWWDIANLREKWLDQAGLWAQIVDCKHRFNQGLGRATEDWSNTPRTAMINDPDIEHMPLADFRKLRGGDYNATVPNLRKRLQHDYDHGPDSPHSRDKEFGGAHQYIDHLKDDIAKHGLHEPIELGSDRRGEFITEGHHRAVAIHELGIDPVPVLRGSPHRRTYAKKTAASGFSEANQFAERLDKGPDEEPYLHEHVRGTDHYRDYTAPTGHQYRLIHDPPGAGGDTITAHQRLSNGKYRGVGYLSWFGGKNRPEDESSNVNGGKIYKVHVSPQHQRRGLASAMLDFGRVHRPDLRHSNALSEDGKAWADKVASFDDAITMTAATEGTEWYHSSQSSEWKPRGEALHVGEGHAAINRGDSGDQGEYLHRFRYRGNAFNSPKNPSIDYVANHAYHEAMGSKSHSDAMDHDDWDSLSHAHADGHIEDPSEHVRKHVAAARQGLGIHYLNFHEGTRPTVSLVAPDKDFEHLGSEKITQEHMKRFAASFEMMRPSELADHRGRDDLDQPWNRGKLDDLKQSIIEHGYDGRGDPIRVGHTPEHGPTIINGNKRLKVLRELGYDGPVPVHKIAMPWFDDGSVSRPRPKSVRKAGFAGLVTDSAWHQDFHDNGAEADQPDHLDNHLAHFVRGHSEHSSTWDQHGHHEDVSLQQPIYATQSHVAQKHVDRYRKDPKATPWAMRDDPDPVHGDDFQGHYRPLFVTHHGRTHVIEGHHRVAAALQEGHESIHALHYDLDKHPVVTRYDGDPCPACVRHASLSEAKGRTEASVGTDYPLRSQAVSKAHNLFGRGLDALFPSDEDGPRATAPAPWPQAGMSKHRKTFDEKLVGRSITHPHEFPVEDVDPRELRATQPSVTRGGVKHYMEGGKDYGKQNGGDNRLGNDIPRVYHRVDDDQKFLLSGHHRGASALLKGEPLRAIVVRGGWGADRSS